ncbi:sialidase family protein [Snuella sedimenti]|uniref:exo-alpha-sialidase n=1 Tax=Snuella sedimenti TaxID=2798802 RepID=A0A8J7J1Z9_9FLAO|nr:sialidase family protein [Snuella sedimenti]MBJ6366578.1 exo-alpha-sialidase [Snuella sedimenti]
MNNSVLFISILLLGIIYLKHVPKGGDDRMKGKVVQFQKSNVLFVPWEEGYACFRIPSVVTTNRGAVLAFCEARKLGCSDTGDIDLVMKKSVDNGLTWSPLRVIWNDNDNVCGNPAPVVDAETGNVHLLATWNNGEDHESEIINGTSIDSRTVFQLTSSDEGETWTQPKDITANVKQDNWSWYATGPVHGIQLKKGVNKGRLVIPCDHIEKDSKHYYSHVIYSDDHGATWKLGGTTPGHQVNECTVAELSNGDLILNMRNYKRDTTKTRQIAFSKDGGITWENQRFDKQLPEPRCQGALLTVKKGDRNILLFTNPADTNSRVNMTLSISYDDGLSWNKKIVIHESHAAYSDLTALQNGDILIFYEAGNENPYEAIRYKIIPKSDL